MPVTTSDIRAWTAQGSQDAAQRTYEAVKMALAPVASRYDVDIFLQGSYANATNTRGDSDVDIVVMLREAHFPDTRRLSELEKVRELQAGRPATIRPNEFRSVVERALADRFGTYGVKSKDKCLYVPKSAGRVDADVVPAFQNRLYDSYPALGSPSFIEGIAILPLSGGRIVNYPKEHIRNGQQKNADCSGRYKQTVRQVKRLRRLAVELGRLTPGDAPGYLLECMVYNVPNSAFLPDDVERLRSVVEWLSRHTPEQLEARFKSCDEVHWLFRTDPGDHNQYTAQRVIAVLQAIL